MRVTLASRGNPDLGQDPEKPLPGVPDMTIYVQTLEEASLVCRTWISFSGLGGGNWAGGLVTNEETGEPMARVSYNGIVWPPSEWTPEMEPLYRP